MPTFAEYSIVCESSGEVSPTVYIYWLLWGSD